MVPQTAMPVLAANDGEIEAAAEIDPESLETEEDAADPAAEESEETEIVEISDTEAGEQDEDVEDEVPVAADGETESTGEETEETVVSEEPAVPNGQDSEIMAVTPSATVVSFDSKSGGDVETADIAYLGGCVDSGKKLAQGKDLRFRIQLKDGRKLKAVEAKIGETGEGKTPTKKDLTNPSADADTIYEVKWDDIKTTVDNKEVGQPVQIVVTTEAQTYDITFAGTNAKIYPVVAIPAAEGATSKGNMPGTTEAGTVTGAAYDTAVTYVVKADSGYKLKDAKVGATPVTIGTTKLYATADAETTSDFDTISITPSEYKKAWDEGTFTVTVNAVAVATLKAEIADNANVTLSDGTSEDADAIKYDADAASDKFAPVTEGELKATSKLSFGVKAADDYEITSVTAVAKTQAQISANEDGTAIPEIAIEKGTPAADGVVPYTISLASLQDFAEDTTVFITVNTAHTAEYEGVNVHTITFAPFKNADVTTGADAAAKDLLEDHIVKVDGENSLQINVTPHTGYVLPKRGGDDDATKNDSVITVTKQVRYETTTDVYGDPEEQTEKIKVNDQNAATLTLTGEDKKYTGATETSDAKKFTVVSATVTINTEVAENKDDKQLYVDVYSALEDVVDYKVEFTEDGTSYKEADLDETLSEDDGSTDEELDNTWYIPEAAKLVKVTVDTEVPVEATLDEDADPLTKEEGDGYVYIFPAAILKADGSKLAITEDTTPEKEEPANVMVKINTNDVTLSKYFVGKESQTILPLGDPNEEGYAALATQAVIGKSLSLTFTEVNGATLKSVSYTMGEEAEQKVDVKKGAATLEIEEVTGELKIVVDSESAYVVKLYDSGDDELEQDADGVYEADYTATGIQIKLVRTEKYEAVSFYDVVVEDGTATAETGATIDPDNDIYATLDQVHESERGKTLTIKVYKKGEEKPFEAKLRTNAESSKVKVTRVVDGKTVEVKDKDSVPAPYDAAMTFKVESVGASLSDLGVKLFTAKEGKALTETEQKWFADNGVVTLNADGTFTITTAAGKDKRDAVEVRIYNKTKTPAANETEKALEGGSFTLNTEGYMIKNDVTGVTATAGVAGNVSVRINLNTTFRDKKNLPAKPETGDLYYKVVLDEIKLAENSKALPDKVTVLTGAALTKYYKLKEADYANPGRTVSIDLVNDAREDKTADIESILSTSIKEVSLVQSVVAKDLETTEDAVTDADYETGHIATIKDKDKALTTKKPLYETKLSVKAVNGAAVVTGQQNVKVATPVFGKETGYDELTVQFVDTKTGVLNGTKGTDKAHQAASQDGGFKAWVDGDDNSIYVSATQGSVTASNYKTLGVKVSANYPQTEIGDGYAATAVVKLNVKQGIYSIEADESKAKLPETIFVQPGGSGKNVSVKITPLYNGGYKEDKPTKTALTWAIEDSKNSNANIQKNLKATKNGKAAPTISVKNGTVTVTKDYQFGKTDADNTFTVTARAADFAGNETKTHVDFTFTVSDEQDTIREGSIVIVNGDGEVKKDVSKLKAEDFDEDLYVAVLRNDVKLGQDSYDISTDFMPVTITSGAKANLDVYASEYNMAWLDFKKPGTKLKINVNTVDGGKASSSVKVKGTLTVDIAPYAKENLGLYLKGADGSEHEADTDYTIQYDGGSNQQYTLYLRRLHTVGDQADYWVNDEYYKNVKVTISGGKFIANKYWAKNINADKEYEATSLMGTAVVVTSNDGKAKITVTDTANKNKDTNHTDYIIENKSYKEAAQKAPSIKLIEPKKITNAALYNEDKGTYSNPIIYQVTDKNVNYAGKYVKVTPDYTVADNMAKYLANEWGTITVSKIDENGYFEIGVPEGKTEWSLSGGNYKMVATVCDKIHGEDKPMAKDVKLSFSIPKPPKTNTGLNVTAKYTLDSKGGSKTDIVVKTGTKYVVSKAMNVIKSKEQGTTKDTHTNEFTKYFEVKAKVNNKGNLIGYTIGLKDDLSKEEIDYITGNTDDKEKQKQAKADCEGYITVTNSSGVSGSGENWAAAGTKYNTKDIKVTVSFKGNNYSVTGASVFAPKDKATTVNVTLMNGKKPVSVVAAAAVGEQSFADANGVKAVEVDGQGVIAITSKATVEANKHEVKMKVVPADSGFIKTAVWNDTTKKYDLTYVNKVNAKGDAAATAFANEAEFIDACGIEVTAKIDVKAVDAAKVISIKNLNVALSADNYEPGAATKMGKYAAYVPYGFIAGNTAIADADGSVKLGVDKDGKTLNEIAKEISGDNFITVEKVEYGEDKIPCIKISVDKAGLIAQAVQTEANKKASGSAKKPVVTTYGAKLKVPVVLTYTNNGSTPETVTFTVTMPRKAMTFEEVTKLLDGTTTIGTGKNARNIKTEIEKMTTPQNEYSKVILKGLLSKVWDKVNDTIPKDADVTLSPDWSEMEWWKQSDATAVTKAQLNDGEPVDDAHKGEAADYNGIMTAGKAVVNLTLTNTLDNTTAPLSYEFGEAALGVKHKYDSDGNRIETDIASAIQTYLNKLTPTNDLTQESLLAEIWKQDGVKEYSSARDSVNIWIDGESWVLEEATEKKAGTFSATVYVNEEDYYATVTDTIARIKNLGDATAALDEAFTDGADGTVQQIVDDCSGIEEKIRANILAEATKAVGNDKLTVAYAQRDKADSNPVVKEPVFDYTPATADAAATVTFKMEITSQSGRKVTYNPTFTLGVLGTRKYFAKAEDAVAAIKKATITTEGSEAEYDLLRTYLIDVENTQDSVEAAIKAMLDETVLESVATGWVAENIEVKYTLATPPTNNGEEEVQHPGEVTFSADIVLKGDKTMKAALEVKDAPAVDWDDSFQTAAHLTAAIEGAKDIEVDAVGDLPTGDDDAAKVTAAKTKLEAAVSGLITNTEGLKVTYDYGEGESAAKYQQDETTKAVTYGPVTITIKDGAGADAKTLDTWTGSFTWSVKA